MDREDYERAKRLKGDLDKLRAVGDAAAGASPSPPPPHSAFRRGAHPDDIFSRALGRKAPSAPMPDTAPGALVAPAVPRHLSARSTHECSGDGGGSGGGAIPAHANALDGPEAPAAHAPAYSELDAQPVGPAPDAAIEEVAGPDTVPMTAAGRAATPPATHAASDCQPPDGAHRARALAHRGRACSCSPESGWPRRNARCRFRAGPGRRCGAAAARAALGRRRQRGGRPGGRAGRVRRALRALPHVAAPPGCAALARRAQRGRRRGRVEAGAQVCGERAPGPGGGGGHGGSGGGQAWPSAGRPRGGCRGGGGAAGAGGATWRQQRARRSAPPAPPAARVRTAATADTTSLTRCTHALRTRHGPRSSTWR